jgi:hypothetical protein
MINTLQPPEKHCPICPPERKALFGYHYLHHLRYCHPVEWENYIGSKTDFGMARYSHFGGKRAMTLTYGQARSAVGSD